MSLRRTSKDLNSKQFLKKFLILKICNSLHRTWRPKTLSGLFPHFIETFDRFFYTAVLSCRISDQMLDLPLASTFIRSLTVLTYNFVKFWFWFISSFFDWEFPNPGISHQIKTLLDESKQDSDCVLTLI